MFFEGINNFLLGLYTDMKNFMVGLPWPILMISVNFFMLFCKGRKLVQQLWLHFVFSFLVF
ncbi:MAG: hypothetical protein CM1200mP13_10740 [Candidatus Pelagibacterales bacterium]|nr:MAG: hypothetical protein CM1200mP13_10740 [Pelagibacterales bacterium]